MTLASRFSSLLAPLTSPKARSALRIFRVMRHLFLGTESTTKETLGKKCPLFLPLPPVCLHSYTFPSYGDTHSSPLGVWMSSSPLSEQPCCGSSTPPLTLGKCSGCSLQNTRRIQPPSPSLLLPRWSRPVSSLAGLLIHLPTSTTAPS